MSKISNLYFLLCFIVLSIFICIITITSVALQEHLSSSIDQLKSRVSILESIIEKNDHERVTKEEDIVETLESTIEKRVHESVCKEEVIEETFETNIDKRYHEFKKILLGRKEEDIVDILVSTIKKSENEWGSMVKDIAEIKKILLEQINASKENKNDTNQQKLYIIRHTNAQDEQRGNRNQEEPNTRKGKIKANKAKEQYSTKANQEIKQKHRHHTITATPRKQSNTAAKHNTRTCNRSKKQGTSKTTKLFRIETNIRLHTPFIQKARRRQ
ncbi:hypothetical protein P8452_13199 [Trifolium repens]|nr:hypothetical protein P8452_13199 [Trifolium repens]